MGFSSLTSGNAKVLLPHRYAFKRSRTAPGIFDRRVRSVPLSMARIVPSRATSAIVAKAATRKVDHSLVWAGLPVFVNPESHVAHPSLADLRRTPRDIDFCLRNQYRLYGPETR